ncbi:MAG: hypothetical protein Q7U36_01350 [bacterium]|nr:hypothetical protein [bacterium]
MSSYSEGQTHQLMERFEAEGFTPDDITRLGQFKNLSKFRCVLYGTHEIKLIERCWREQDGVIYFSLPPTDGTTGPQWIKRLEKKGFRLSKWAKDVLSSPDFKPTNGIISNIAVLKGMLWNYDSDRTTKNIRAEADRRNLIKPNAEVACLIREMFSDKELEAMGLLWIVAMHDPIKDSCGGPDLLRAGRDGGGRWLGTAYGGPDDEWSRHGGFAFVASQVSTQDSVS